MRSILPWAVVVLGGWLGPESLAARPGYLPTVGPLPLRYLEGRAKPVEPAVLPPLAPAAVAPEPAASEPENAVETAKPAPAKEEPAPPTEPAKTAPEPPPTTVTRQETIPAPSTTPSTAISPQLLIRYFTSPDSTNRAAPVVIAPVGFVPPPTGAAPSSKATYSTVP